MKGRVKVTKSRFPTQKQIEDKLEQTAETAEKVANIIRLSDAQKQQMAESHPEEGETSKIIPQNELLGIMFTPAPDNRPEIPRPLVYGACRFCGQARSVTECYSEDAANEQATRLCNCGDAQIYQDRLRASAQREADLQRVNSNLKSLFGSLRPETMELMQKAAEAVYDRKVVNASIKLSDMVSAKISRNSKGNIAIERKDAAAQKVEV